MQVRDYNMTATLAEATGPGPLESSAGVMVGARSYLRQEAITVFRNDRLVSVKVQAVAKGGTTVVSGYGKDTVGILFLARSVSCCALWRDPGYMLRIII